MDPAFVTAIARTVYGLEPQAIASLDQLALDWRGLARVHDPRQGV